MTTVRRIAQFTFLLLVFSFSYHCIADDSFQEYNLGNMPSEPKPESHIRPSLQDRYDALSQVARIGRPNSIAHTVQASASGNLHSIVVDAVAKDDGNQAQLDLSNLGLRNIQVNGRHISGDLPLYLLPELKKIESINEIYPSSVLPQAGSVTSQGDRAMQADQARAVHGVDGAGITIGVISDSFDCLGGASTDKASADLPQAATALEDAYNCNGLFDEGRALMQVIHDIAPGAELVFHTGSNGLAAAANGIIELATTAGADIIVDDLKIYTTPFFQDDLITQSVREVNSMGVVYITAAGNSARLSYESPYVDTINRVLNANVHDFDPGPEVDVYQQFRLEEGGSISLALQWDSLSYSHNGLPGAEVDLDIFILDESETTVLASGTFNNIGKDPFEQVEFFNPLGSGETRFNIAIAKITGKSPQLIKYVIFGRFDGEILEFTTDSGTIVGHANSEYTLAVGAVDYRKTPSYGVPSPVLEYFSSAGGSAILFDDNGDRFPSPVVTLKPDFVAPNNVNTTFFIGDDPDGDGLPNFRGTSAAAPHAAAVAALVLEANNRLSPLDVGFILRSSSIDILERSEPISQDIGVGVDFDSGYGLINADAAVALAVDFDPLPNQSDTDPSATDFTFNEITQATDSGIVDWAVLLISGGFLVLRNLGFLVRLA